MGHLIIDLDGIYNDKAPANGSLVLTNLYNKAWAINVYSFLTNRKGIFREFGSLSFQQIEYPHEKSPMILFLSFFYPLGQWFMVIDQLEKEKKINKNTRIEFTSYSKNRNAFLFEAEGESNGQFLYKKSYFLSFYIKKFFESRGYGQFTIQSNKSIRSKIDFFLRNLIVVNLKFTLLIVSKFLTFKRAYGNLKLDKTKNVYSSRALIQSQFAKSIFTLNADQNLLVVNESSTFPFRNLKYVKRNYEAFYYAEGLLTFNQFLKLYAKALKTYISNSTSTVNFFGIEIQEKHITKELAVFNLHMESYALSVRNALKKIHILEDRKVDKLISFEMLFPFVSFLKKFIHKDILQIQTASIFNDYHPNFIYGKKFYFTNEPDYVAFLNMDAENCARYDLLNNLKYFGVERKEVISAKELKKVVYFTQPIYLEEELEILHFLKSQFDKTDISFEIKLHPRSSQSDYNNMGFTFSDKLISSLDIIQYSDLVITRNSSIGVDAWSYNVPVLFFTNGTLKSDTMSYIPEDYSGNFVEFPHNDNLISKLQSIMEDFYTHSYHRNFVFDNNEVLKKLYK